MKHSIVVWFNIYGSGEIDVSTYAGRANDDNVFGPYNVEFDIPPDVVMEALARKEAKHIDGSAKKTPALKAVAKSGRGE